MNRGYFYLYRVVFLNMSLELYRTSSGILCYVALYMKILYIPKSQAFFKQFLYILILSLTSKINPNPALPAAFISFFRRIFFMAIAMKIHLKKECGGKRIGIKEKITGINCDRRDA